MELTRNFKENFTQFLIEFYVIFEEFHSIFEKISCNI